MSTVTVIGTGNVGGAVAALASKGGAEVQVLGRDPQKVQAIAGPIGASAGSIGDAIAGDVVVLALPYPALREIADLYGAQLDGKVLVDPTNPVDFATFDGLTVPADSSAAAELQALVPNAAVVKAFNTTFAGSLASGRTGEAPATVLVAGDDDAAKRAVVDLVTAGGVAAVVVGSLKRARELEAIGFLQVALAVQQLVGFTGGFALHK